MHEPARSPVSLPPLRSALTAPFVVAGRELAEMASRPLPFVGGMFGALLGCAALAAALLWMPSSAAAEPEPTFTVAFIPASLVSAGEIDGQISEASEPAPEVPVPEDPALDAAQPEASSEPEHSDAVSESAQTPKPQSPEPAAPKPRPEVSPSPAPSPAPAPPPPGTDSDSPFQDPNAWSDLLREGDPWAAAVLSALRSMKVPAFAGKIDAAHPYAFRLRVCKDGRVDKVLSKRSTGDTDLDATLAHEITRLKLPPVPSALAASMGRACVVLDYTFAWSSSGIS